MSLLMQALQKAAKEREGAAQSQPQASVLSGDLALEPLEAVARQDSMETGAAGPRSPEAPKPAHAAILMQAKEVRGGVGERQRDHRKTLYATLIGLAVLGYAASFYISVFHPALFRRTPAAAVAAVSPPPTPSVTPPAGVRAAVDAAAPAVAPSSSAGGAEETMRQPGTPPQERSAARATGEPRRAMKSSLGIRPYSSPAEPATRPPGDSISVKQGGETLRVSPELADAYEALRQGRFQDARRLYDSVLRSDPRNVDGLLGRAMVAQQQGDPDLATRYLFQVLQADPANTLAQGGLINLIGQADPQSAESKLKHLIAKDPSAFLYFALGNVYADKGNWPAAQGAYFQAHHLQRDDPDYAFNLAVSLEHLSQPKLALNFYRQALDLSRASGRANFDSSVVRDRIARVAADIE